MRDKVCHIGDTVCHAIQGEVKKKTETIKTQLTTSIEARKKAAWRRLWEELHRQPLPINHAIPRLTIAIPIPRPRKPTALHFKSLTFLTLLSACLTGCQVLTYSGPNGEHFSRTSFGSTTSISSLSVEAQTNGVRRVELRGYTNDSTSALGAVTEAAVRAAIQGAK